MQARIAGVRDALRTGAVIGGTLALVGARFARLPRGPTPGSNSADGLVAIANTARRIVRALGIELEVRGVERVPTEGGLLFLWNQESHLDHVVVPCAVPRPFFSLYNNEVARFPFYGEYLRRSGHCHVDRNDENQWVPVIDEAARRIHDGECLLASPEGTRSHDGELLPMKRGVFMLARKALRPIVCVTVIGGHQRMPRGAWFVRPGPMRVVLCDPIPVEPATYDDLEDRVRDRFIQTKRENAL